MSQYCYHRYDPEFAARAKSMGKSIIVAGHNYGVKAVIAKSIARIHMGNLINHGIIPMIFEDPADYDHLDQLDELEIENLLDNIPTRRLEVKNKTKNRSFFVKLQLTDNEVEVVLSGGQLSYLKKQLKMS